MGGHFPPPPIGLLLRMVTPIQLPDDAPFTPEQRAWLNDFLTKALGAGFQASPGPTVPVTVLFGSQTGTAEGLAGKLFKTLQKGAFETEIHDLASYDTARLASEKNLLVIVSTYGDGEPPDSATAFYDWFLSPAAPRLEGVSYSVLALGDSSYPEFCKCGRDIDARFRELGATALHDRVDVDVDPDEPFATWSKAVIARLAPGAGIVAAPVESEVHEGYSKQHPFPAAVLENRNLNGPGPRQTHHIALSLDGSGLEYEVGDALGVFPVNRADAVDEILANLPFKPGTVTAPDGREIPLRDALLHHYDIGTINKALVRQWQARSGSPMLRALVEAEDNEAWDKFCHGRELIDLIVDFPADFPDGDEFVGVLRKLQPRLYSISSSPLAHPGEVHLTVAIVRYTSHGRARGGVCSTYLADRLTDTGPPKVYVHKNPAFRPPADGATPMIMVGPGTGIAPFRAFLEHRRATGATGRNWLLFGNPHQATDFLYQEELEGFLADGTLQRLDLAWSRDQAEKIYVQHLMMQQGAELWSWLQEGASFFVCGDASRMAKDVDAALHRIAVEHGGLADEDATAFLAGLRKDKRYQRDVY